MTKKEDLQFIDDIGQGHMLVESLIKKKGSNGPISILEAGCGREWPFRLKGIQYFLTGVDIDKKALEIRKNTLSDLHETIEGDLRSVDLGTDVYDVIYNSYVLEHIEGADVAIKNFVQWAKPDGLIIIRVPDPYSVHGYITRVTPHWFHIFCYRFIFGIKTAGKPGYGPYITFYDPIISRSGIRKFCDEKSNNITLEAEYADKFVRRGQGLMEILMHTFIKSVSLLSLGLLSGRHTSLLYVLRKNATDVKGKPHN